MRRLFGIIILCLFSICSFAIEPHFDLFLETGRFDEKDLIGCLSRESARRPKQATPQRVADAGQRSNFPRETDLSNLSHQNALFLYKGCTFFDLMGINTYGINGSRKKLRPSDFEELAEIKELFMQNCKYLSGKTRPNKIPKIVHFIWIGPKPFPQESIKNIESWQSQNPGWEFTFWTDSETRECPCPGMTKMLVQDFDFSEIAHLLPKTSNWGEKSDLLRFVILRKLGGVYADHDAECLHPFEKLLHFDFFACLERPHYHQAIDTFILPANGLFGAIPEHPVILGTLRILKKRWARYERLFPSLEGQTPLWKVIERTYDSFVLAAKKYANQNGKLDILLPTCFFYPRKILPQEKIKTFIQKKLIWSNHHYANSWKDNPDTLIRKVP